MSVELQNEPWIPGGVPVPMSWDPVGKLWVPSPPAPGSITTAMLAPNAATLVHFVAGVSSTPTTTSTTPVPLADMTVTFTPPVPCDVLCTFFGNFASSVANANPSLGLMLDGVQVSNSGAYITQNPTAVQVLIGSFQMLLPQVSAAPHTVLVNWLTNAGTLNGMGTIRTFSVVEFRR